LLAALHAESTSNTLYTEEVCTSYTNLALLLGRSPEAQGAWLQVADLQLSLKNHAAAALAVEELIQVVPPRWQGYDRAAAILGRSASLAANDDKLPEAKRKEQAQLHADRAVELLRLAVDNGYRDLDALKRSEDFRQLQFRQDFQALLGDVAKRVSLGP